MIIPLPAPDEPAWTPLNRAGRWSWWNWDSRTANPEDYARSYDVVSEMCIRDSFLMMHIHTARELGRGLLGATPDNRLLYLYTAEDEGGNTRYTLSLIHILPCRCGTGFRNRKMCSRLFLNRWGII